ncbi:MAG TPA: hypothetical protein VK540_20210 [Polyangiaceae bacterium]|nr:hypothetical protein [Polyangiaceae bacterium]
MTDLSPEAKELLRKARSAFSPPEGRLEAVRAAMEARLAASQGGTLAPSSSASGVATRALRAAGWSTSQVVSAALVIGALGAGGLTAWLMADRQSPGPGASIGAPAQTPSTAAAPAEPEEGAPPSAWSPDPPPSLSAAQTDLAPSSKASPATPDRTHGAMRPRARGETSPEAIPGANSGATDSLAAEVRLLRDARAALDRGDAVQALRLVDTHRKRFPRGTLYEERLATRVQVLCALGLPDGARLSAQELERTAPRSPHLARVRASCIAQPPSK